MGDKAVRVENLSKRYEIGAAKLRYDTLRDQIMESLKTVISRNGYSRQERNIIWALKDVSLEIEQGEVVGIIGRNGAGKSTLLKILSRITGPTSGSAEIHGRVGSLLEVGTGFHPELTGRENIYLNGAILGMKKAEIDRNFDAIVVFAETEKFLDTPVKHYSSGMYVRLAFAVAAHLEPEILIVDEVLAVGDVQFQKKCLGKMQDISKTQGRTVLFVSHNMDAVQRLCSKCLMFEEGRLVASGNTVATVSRYLSRHFEKAAANEWIDVSQSRRTGTGEARFVAVQYSSLNEAVGFQPYSDGPLEFLLAIVSDSSRSIGSIAVTLYSQSGTKFVNADTVSLGRIVNLREGRNLVRLRINKLYLNPGIYVVGLWVANPIEANRTGGEYDQIQAAFEIEVVQLESRCFGIKPDSDGVVSCPFELVEVN
jgi:lipopolysaccharide transport system ATP-binding protein